MKDLVRRSLKPSPRVGPEGRIVGANPTDEGTVKKAPSSGDKGNPPYPPLSGGYEKATPAAGRGLLFFLPP